MDIEDLIKKLPKAELHIHIEGSLEPELMFQIAKRNKINLPYSSIEDLKTAYNFHNLQSFLNIYYEGTKVLINEEDFYDMTWAYLEKIHKDNVKHTEIFFDPQSHTSRDIPFKTMFNGIHKACEDGKKKLGISYHLIMCFLRHLSGNEAMKTLEESIPFKDKIIAVGLDSSEVGNPPEKFKGVFEKAISYGYLTVAHAGEEGPPDYIWGALDLLKVKRIDHGVRCLEDPKLIEVLRESEIPLTVCPFSNVKLKVFKDLKDHNLKKLLDNNLIATINSDDPAYFGGYISDNYIETQKALNLNKKEMIRLAKNSFKASFLSEEEKRRHIEEIDKISRS